MTYKLNLTESEKARLNVLGSMATYTIKEIKFLNKQEKNTTKFQTGEMFR